MFTVDRRVGRLVESVMRSPVTVEEIRAVDAAMFEAARALRRPIVIIADFRQTKFLLQEDAERLVGVFRHHNESIERSAILVSASSAVGVLQMERLIREAASPVRRAFRDPEEAIAWLDEVLTPPERERLRIVLASHT